MAHKPSLFIWYRADARLIGKIRAWLQEVESETGFKGQLFVRHEDDGSTFMEVFHGVDSDAQARLEFLAAGQDCFTEIDGPRRCEVFYPDKE